MSIRSLTVLKARKACFFYLALAVAYGAFLTVLPLEVFKDRTNYLNYASSSLLILERYVSRGLLVAVFNEPIWLVLNSFLGMFFPPATVVRLLIFLPATTVAWLTLRHRKGWIGWAFFLLFFPPIVKKHVIQLRQGVAIAIFLLGWYAPRRSWRWALWVVVPFIHSSFFFVLVIYAVVTVTRVLQLSIDLRLLLILCVSVVISLSLPWVAYGIGARQAFEYEIGTVSVSGFGFLFWALVLAIFLSQGSRFLRWHAFEVSTVVFYLGMYFLALISARIYENTLLLVLLSGLHLEKYRRYLFLAMMVAFMFLSYYLHIGQPWLGWGK